MPFRCGSVSTIFVTEGHIAAGISEKAMPSMTMGMIGVRLVRERIRWTRTSNRDPYTITLALFPFVSVNHAKQRGEKNGAKIYRGADDAAQFLTEREFVLQQIGCIFHEREYRRIEGYAKEGDVYKRPVGEQQFDILQTERFFRIYCISFSRRSKRRSNTV